MPVDCAVDGSLHLAVALGWDIGLGAARPDPLDQRLGVIAPVSHDMGSSGQAVDQGRRRRLVAGLPGSDGQPDRQARLVDDRIDLGAQSATRATGGVIRAPFFPPAACWWARMTELSMNAMDSGDLSAKALNTLIQTPALAHRLKRLQTVV